MDSSKIALFTEYFNILSVTALGFFAFYGFVTVIFKRHRLNIFRGRVFAQVFCVASLLALAAESTFFNYEYYARYLNDSGFDVIGVSPEDSTVLLTTDPAVTAKLRVDSNVVALTPARYYAGPAPRDSGVRYDTVWTASGLEFNGFKGKLASIYIEPVFGSEEFLDFHLRHVDAQGVGGGIVRFYRGFPRGNHVVIQSCAAPSELSIAQSKRDLLGSVTAISVNKQIPLYFSGIRMLALSCLFFAAIVFARKKLRARAADLLFRLKFDPSDRKQNRAYVYMTALLLLYSFVCAFTSTDKFWRESVYDMQYNVFLADALLDGREYLDAGQPEMLQIAERPYDLAWLRGNGFNDATTNWWYGDWAYYKGKLYSYFGVVPAVLLFVPYKMITGDYLPNYAGIFVFMAAAIVLMAALWRHIAKKYMPGVPFAFYMLSFITLFFASGLFVPLRFTRFYSIVLAAGFMFVIAGVLLLLKSVDTEKHSKRPCGVRLFFACLCFALAVGCRPNLVLASLIVPVVLWRYRSFKTAVIAAIPYIMVAIPLCYYNYIRFGSIADFGVKYNLTNMNVGAMAQLSVTAKLSNAFVAAVHYLFTLNHYSLFYPYVETINQLHKLEAISRKFFDKGPGIINFPIVFCLFFYFRALFAKLFSGRQALSGARLSSIEKPPFVLSSALLAIAFATIFLNSWLIGHSGRYITDFAFFILLPSILYAYQWCKGGAASVGADGGVRRLKVAYVLLTASVFVGLCLFAGDVSNDASPGDIALDRYLKYSLGVLK